MKKFLSFLKIGWTKYSVWVDENEDLFDVFFFFGLMIVAYLKFDGLRSYFSWCVTADSLEYLPEALFWGLGSLGSYSFGSFLGSSLFRKKKQDP